MRPLYLSMAYRATSGISAPMMRSCITTCHRHITQDGSGDGEDRPIEMSYRAPVEPIGEIQGQSSAVSA